MAEPVPEVPGQQPAGPETTFALTPAGASHECIDYAVKSGESLWRQATTKLTEELFDCIADGLRDFLLS